METDMAVALVAGGVALASAALSLWGQGRTTRLESNLDALRLAEQRRFDLERAASQYLEPLAQAAYDLQSRLFNILEQNLMEAYYQQGDERSRAYVVDNTAFLVAQYFGWTEAVRQSIRFVDLGHDEQTRQSFLDPEYVRFPSERRSKAIGDRSRNRETGSTE